MYDNFKGGVNGCEIFGKGKFDMDKREKAKEIERIRRIERLKRGKKWISN